MRFLADENVPAPSIRLLRQEGWDVESVSERAAGIDDETVLARARDGGRVLVTFDRDFGELVYRRGAAAPAGIVYLRPGPADPEEPARILLALFGMEGIDLVGRFTIVDRGRIRQRPLAGTG